MLAQLLFVRARLPPGHYRARIAGLVAGQPGDKLKGFYRLARGVMDSGRENFAALPACVLPLIAAFYAASLLLTQPAFACMSVETEFCASGGGFVQRVQWRRHKAHLDAMRFSSQIKRHLVSRFATSKQQFRSHQVKLEQQRRAYRRNKARTKAQQYAAARRRAALHSPRRYRPRILSMARQKTPPNDMSGRRWRALWHHGASRDAHNGEQQPAD